MSDTSAFGFGKFIPGFEFLQNLGKTGSTSTGLPPFSHWVAPTVRVEEIEKRIEELKAVQFWLDQNSKALAATVQALEVQRMTLSTLKGMNVNLADLASGFGFTHGHSEQPQADGDLSQWPMSAAGKAAAAQAAAPQPAPEPAAAAAPPVQEPPQSAAPDSTSQSAHNASMAAATQWWGALTQQFQQIAQQALQDPAQQQAVVQATQMTTEFAKTAVKAAADMVKQAVVPAAKPAAVDAGIKSAALQKKPAARAAKPKKSTSSDKKATSVQAKVVTPKAQQSKTTARKKPAR